MRRVIGLILSVVTMGAGAGFAEGPLGERLRLPADVQGRTLYGVFFLDAKQGWIVGAQGLCLKTRDGGANWELQKTGSGATLRCVQFQDAQTGWACGDGDPQAPPEDSTTQKFGTLLHTADGGKTWKTFWIPSTFEIPWLEASTAPRIQVAMSGGAFHPDGHIFRSPDGGETWGSHRCFRALLAVRAIDAKRWTAVGSRVSVGFQPTPVGDPLYDHKACRALYSTDGGATWKVSEGSDGDVADGFLWAVAVGKNRTVLAAGNKGVILRSVDAGVHWTKAAIPTAGNLRGAAWCGPWAIAVGNKGLGGTVVLGVNDGKSWKQPPVIRTPPLFGVAAAGDEAIAVGQGGTALRLKIGEFARRQEQAPK